MNKKSEKPALDVEQTASARDFEIYSAISLDHNMTVKTNILDDCNRQQFDSEDWKVVLVYYA